MQACCNPLGLALAGVVIAAITLAVPEKALLAVAAAVRSGVWKLLRAIFVYHSRHTGACQVLSYCLAGHALLAVFAAPQPPSRPHEPAAALQTVQLQQGA